jgi:hypothetical protein
MQFIRLIRLEWALFDIIKSYLFYEYKTPYHSTQNFNII